MATSPKKDKKSKSKSEKKLEAPAFIPPKDPLTVEEALGDQNKGVILPKEVRAELESDQRKVKELNEFRMDVLRPIDDRLGLQFVEESPYPWISDATIKLNLGAYREFGTFGWINIGEPGGPRRQFNVPLESLNLGEKTVDFIFAPFVLEGLSDPVRCLRMWRGCLKDFGMIAVVVNDLDKLLRQGRRFEESKYTAAQVARMLDDAGYAYKVEINFAFFGLAGDDPGYSGWFAWR